jgi:hypothetical protein
MENESRQTGEVLAVELCGHIERTGTVRTARFLVTVDGQAASYVLDFAGFNRVDAGDASLLLTHRHAPTAGVHPGHAQVSAPIVAAPTEAEQAVMGNLSFDAASRTLTLGDEAPGGPVSVTVWLHADEEQD